MHHRGLHLIPALILISLVPAATLSLHRFKELNTVKGPPDETARDKKKPAVHQKESTLHLVLQLRETEKQIASTGEETMKRDPNQSHEAVDPEMPSFCEWKWVPCKREEEAASEGTM